VHDPQTKFRKGACGGSYLLWQNGVCFVGAVPSHVPCRHLHMHVSESVTGKACYVFARQRVDALPVPQITRHRRSWWRRWHWISY
jgi:hypothetical protein